MASSYVTLTVQFRHTVKEFQVLLYIANISIKYQSFVYTQLNSQTVVFLIMQFSISHLFAYSLDGQTVLSDP